MEKQFKDKFNILCVHEIFYSKIDLMFVFVVSWMKNFAFILYFVYLEIGFLCSQMLHNFEIDKALQSKHKMDIMILIYINTLQYYLQKYEFSMLFVIET